MDGQGTAGGGASPGGFWRRYLPVILTACLGAVVSITMFVIVGGWERERIRLDFERRAIHLAVPIQRSIDESIEVIHAIRCFYEASPTISRQHFAAFVNRAISRHPSIQALEWIPRVRDVERASYEAAARRDGYPDFQITERKAQGQMVKAAKRAEYFPVYYVEPFKGNEIALGFDLASNPARLEALERARDTGAPAATSRIVLVQETGEQSGFLIFVPTYGPGNSHKTVEERRRSLQGFALGVFRIGDLVETSLKGLDAADIDIIMHDESASAPQRLLYHQGRRESGLAEHATDPDDSKGPMGLHWRETFDVAGRQWSLLFLPTPRYSSASRTWQPWGVLVVSLLLTLVLAAYFSMAIGRAHLLTQAKESLESEVFIRKQAEESLLRRTKQLETVRAVTAEITRELNLRSLLDLTIRESVSLVGGGSGTIRLWDEARQVLTVGASYGMEQWIEERQLRLGEGFSGTVAQRRQGMIINDSRTSPYADPIVLECTEFTAVLAEPLVYHDRLLGVITVDRYKGQPPFTEADQSVLALLASQVAIAIENARLHEAAVRRGEELEALLQASRSVMSGLDLQAMLEQIVAEAAQISGCPHIKLLLVDRETGLLRIGVHTGTTVPDGFPVPLGTGLSGIVAQTGQPLFVPDTHTDPRSVLGLQVDKKLGMLTYLGLPIKIRDEVLGVLTFNTAEPRVYTADELAYLTCFADQAAIALANARLHAAAVRRGEELEALLRASRTVMAGLDLKGTLDRIIAEAARIARTPHIKVVLVDREAQALRIAAAAGRPAEMLADFRHALGSGLSGLVATRGEPLFVPNCQDDPRNFGADQDRALGIQTYLGLPIKSRDEILGVLTFNTTEPREYTPEELNYLTSFADQAAIAIENARLHERLTTRLKRQQALTRLSQLISSSLNVDAVLSEIAQAAAELMGDTQASFWTVDEASRTLEPRAFSNAGIADYPRGSLRFGEGGVGWVAEHRQPLNVPNRYADERFFAQTWAKEHGFVSFLGVPVVLGGSLLAVLVLNGRQPFRLDPDDQSLLDSFVAQAAIAIENARLYEATVRQLAELKALYDMGQAITSSLSLDEQLEILVERLGQATGAQRVLVGLLDPEGAGGFRLCLAHDASKEDPWLRNLHLSAERYPEVLEAVRTRRPLVIPDVSAEPLLIPVREHLDPVGLRSLVVMPLIVQGRAVGAISLGFVGKSRTFTEEEVSLLQSFATQAAIAIEKARLYEGLRQAAIQLEAKVEDRTRELQAANAQLQEATRRAEEASRYKSEFLANMSHEIRTPLNSILGFSQLLLELTKDVLPAKQNRYLTNIYNSGKHLLQLINDILDLSKVEAGKFVLQPEALPVAETLEDILVIARGLAHKKAQAIRVEIEPGLPVLCADPVRLKQILFNLLSNAVKFTPDGGTVRVTAHRVAVGEGSQQKAEGSEHQAADGGSRLPTADRLLPTAQFLELRVTDTGAGIRPEDMPKLFREFTQLETTQAQRHEGSGLGLALTKRLVELHGGRIWAESEGVDKGSTFTVLLPFGGA